MNIQPPDLNREALEAKVAVDGHRIQCTTRDYCPHLVPVMRSVRYEFNKPPPVWFRVCSERHGDINHRAAELVLALLHAGIPVDCADKVADLALSGEVEPVYPRWIHVDSKLRNHLAIEATDDDFDKYSLEGLGVRDDYSRDDIWYVKPWAWRNIRDFAEREGFRFTSKAERVLADIEARERARLLLDDLPDLPRKPVIDKYKPARHTGIHPELLDDD